MKRAAIPLRPVNLDEVNLSGHHILVVDDDAAHAESIAEVVSGMVARVSVVGSGKEARELLLAETVDIVLTDLRLPDGDGIEVVRWTRDHWPDTEVILITGYASVESAVEAMRCGAFTYLTKPIHVGELRTAVQRAAAAQELSRHSAELQRRVDARFGFEGILGHSAPMKRLLEVLVRVAPSNATVLISGESGTGKELVAQAIHANSPRRAGPFVAVNCAAFSPGVLESELFGHEKGAFTGAIARRMGVFESAEGGTLLLDEVGEIPPDMQPKLLRAIEAREVQRVGGTAPIKVDVRILAATNRDLRQAVADAQFREDLFFRLAVVEVTLPPLRERGSDIPLLLDAFLREFSAQHGKAITGISPEARRALYAYSWPGNIRELRNYVENMVLLASDSILGWHDLPEPVLAEVGRSRPAPVRPAPVPRHQGLAGLTLKEAEETLIRATLEETGGHRAEAAKRLGIGLRTLYRKLKEYGIA